MAQDNRNIIAITERCLIDKADEAWNAFIADTEELVRKVFLKNGGGSDLKSFCEWFYGWLFEKRKLHSAYIALSKKIDAGECPSLESQISFFENYLARIVSSACSEFYSDAPKESLLQDPDTLDSFPAKQDSSEDRDSSRQMLEDALAQLTPQLRIPFVLRNHKVFGCPNEEDIAWVSAETGRPEDEIIEAIETEARQYPSRTYQLSSAFIGDLLDLRRAAVDQRTRRAQQRMKEILQQKKEED